MRFFASIFSNKLILLGPGFMGKNHLAGKFMFANLFKLYIFLPFWDTMVEVFFRCGIQQKSFSPLWDQQRRFSSIVGYNGRGFPPLWDTTEKNLRMANNFFSVVSQNAEVFLRGVLH
jgi:hypothetical protein